MQKIYFVLAFVFTVNFLQAQVYDGPESVELDPSDGSVFVSNANAGNIVKLLPNGTLQSFASGFTSGPHGLELIGDTLYACDGSNLRLVNRSTGAIINTVVVSGSTFLNGITHKGKMIYITDFSAKRVYRFNTINNSYNIFTSTLTKSPNGIIYDYLNDRLVYCTWGTSAPVYEVSLADSTINLLATTAQAYCDGIAMNCQGQFYVASWGSTTPEVKRYNSTFVSVTTVTIPGLNDPADIYFTSNDTLIIPNSGGNTVSKTHLASCITSVEDVNERATSVYPNPFTSNLNIENHDGFTKMSILNSLGQVVSSINLNAGNNMIDLGKLVQGTYFVQLKSATHIKTIKVCKN